MQNKIYYAAFGKRDSVYWGLLCTSFLGACLPNSLSRTLFLAMAGRRNMVRSRLHGGVGEI